MFCQRLRKSPFQDDARYVHVEKESQDSLSLFTVRKICIDKMPNDLDQYLRAEIAKQFKGRLIVVLDKNEADAILTGVNEERKGTGAQITGRYLGLHDNATGTVSLLDKLRNTSCGPTKPGIEACFSAW